MKTDIGAQLAAIQGCIFILQERRYNLTQQSGKDSAIAYIDGQIEALQDASATLGQAHRFREELHVFLGLAHERMMQEGAH